MSQRPGKNSLQPPELSEVERLKLENFTLRHIAIEAQLRQNQLDRAIFLRSIEAAHPGWRWQDPVGLVSEEDEPRVEPYPEMTPQ